VSVQHRGFELEGKGAVGTVSNRCGGVSPGKGTATDRVQGVEGTKMKTCPVCGQPVNEIEGKHYCFRCCSEIKDNGDDDEKT